jgi:hypothetical protein
VPHSLFDSLGGRQASKILLTRIGSLFGPRTVYNLNGVFNYLHVGWWLRAQGYATGRRVSSRFELFDLLAASIRDEVVLYLEFGVAEGASIRYWSSLLRNPRSRLHGFDSFLGLPHDWSLEGHPRGTFSTDGRPPAIEDPRVEFFPGWFEDTLSDYAWPAYDVLVVVMDADLYSSTATALSFVRERLVPGSLLYFDQFHHRADELRAFAELVDENDFRFRLVGASRELSNVAFERVA